jgi:hypothetical protein
MRRRGASDSLPKEDVLKIDKDCVVDKDLEREYVRTVLDICGKHGIRVLWIRYTNTAHGVHYYIKINPPVDAMTANALQYLLGDDTKRFGFNKARIKSALVGWNKPFERSNAKLRTLYKEVAPLEIDWSPAMVSSCQDMPHSIGFRSERRCYWRISAARWQSRFVCCPLSILFSYAIGRVSQGQVVGNPLLLAIGLVMSLTLRASICMTCCEPSSAS